MRKDYYLEIITILTQQLNARIRYNKLLAIKLRISDKVLINLLDSYLKAYSCRIHQLSWKTDEEKNLYLQRLHDLKNYLESRIQAKEQEWQITARKEGWKSPEEIQLLCNQCVYKKTLKF